MAFGHILDRSRRIALAAGICALAISPIEPILAQVDHESPSSSENDNPAVAAGKAWLEVNKITDEAEFQQAMRDLWPTLPGPPDQWIAARTLFSSFEFRAVGATTADTAELWLFDPVQDSYVLANVMVDASDPEKVAGIRVRPTDDLPPGVAPPPSLSGPALIDAVQARALEMAQNGRFDGAVLLAEDGSVLFQRAYGFADAEAEKPNTVETQFRFGSMGKMFTAVAIMQLIEAGKVDAAAPIGRYLPDYANRDIADKVTVAHLLSHTGGTGDIFGPEFISHLAELRDPSDYVDLYEDRAPAFEPGSRAAYSNYGFMLLGRIVETTSGLPYDEYAARHIWGPAGMASTGNQPESVQLPRRAIAYTGMPGDVIRADDTLPYRGTPAGGGYSTVGDFLRFATALVSGELMKPATFEMLVDGGVALPDGTFIPYDFGGTISRNGRFIGHGGGAPGMNGMLMHFLDSGYTIVVLANRDPPASDTLANFVARRLPAPEKP